MQLRLRGSVGQHTAAMMARLRLPPLRQIYNLRDLVRRDDAAVVMRDIYTPERGPACRPVQWR